MRKPTVEAGCMDCHRRTTHRTVTAATAACEAHLRVVPTHRPMVADANGWRRIWLEAQS